MKKKKKTGQKAGGLVTPKDMKQGKKKSRKKGKCK